MNLKSLIDYFNTAPMPPYPIKYSIHAMAGPNFIAYFTGLARTGNPHALERLEELYCYLENQKKPSKKNTSTVQN